MINQTKQKAPAVTGHSNFMAGTSYDINNPLTKLRVAASSCFFGEPAYYIEGSEKPAQATVKTVHGFAQALRDVLGGIDPIEWRRMTTADLMTKAIDDALDFDAEATLQEAVRLRMEDNIRTTPQVIMVRAARHKKVIGTPLIAKYAAGIMQRADEPCVQLAYFRQAFCPASSTRLANKKIPNSLKRAWASFIEALDEKALAKYAMNSRVVSLRHVINLVHANSPAIDKFCKDKLSNTEQTWEAIVSEGKSSVESWTKAIDIMGHMALLRNLRNLIQKKVPIDLFLDKLVEGAPFGRQLPFRYYSAYLALTQGGISNPRVISSIEQCMRVAIGNMPHFKGRVASLCDNSGSAQGATVSSMSSMQVNRIANLSGILTGQCADEGYLALFGDSLTMLPVRREQSIIDLMVKADQVGATVGQGTENGAWMFFDKAIREKEHWDTIFIYSDMQAGHGGLYGVDPRAYKAYQWMGSRNIDVAKLIKTYREQVNKDVLVFMVQVAGYQDTLVPEFYRKTYILGGWGEGVIKFAAQMAQLESLDTIKKPPQVVKPARTLKRRPVKNKAKLRQKKATKRKAKRS